MSIHLQRRVQALEDRERISELLARFCDRVDHYDIDGLDTVFTEDCFTDYGPARGGPVEGLTAVRERIRRGQAEFRRTHHQLGQVVTSSLAAEEEGRLPDTARSTAYVTATHEDWQGRISRVHLCYHDVLRRTPGGWRIARRTVTSHVVDGMPGEWAWAERELPEGRRGT